MTVDDGIVASGCLIQSKQDKDITGLLNLRILTKNYENALLRPMLKCPLEVT
jgi:hypothetical protein